MVARKVMGQMEVLISCVFVARRETRLRSETGIPSIHAFFGFIYFRRLHHSVLSILVDYDIHLKKKSNKNAV